MSFRIHVDNDPVLDFRAYLVPSSITGLDGEQLAFRGACVLDAALAGLGAGPVSLFDGVNSSGSLLLRWDSQNGPLQLYGLRIGLDTGLFVSWAAQAQSPDMTFVIAGVTP